MHQRRRAAAVEVDRLLGTERRSCSRASSTEIAVRRRGPSGRPSAATTTSELPLALMPSAHRGYRPTVMSESNWDAPAREAPRGPRRRSRRAPFRHQHAGRPASRSAGRVGAQAPSRRAAHRAVDVQARASRPPGRAHRLVLDQGPADADLAERPVRVAQEEARRRPPPDARARHTSDRAGAARGSRGGAPTSSPSG